ncbi:hypothetical protein [Klebsiella aerogenes]|uniref:hypothetical protein n=1 Tax=Klebsiella aerogenes TaxID=548 RepID=UPI00375079C6
MKIRPNNKWWYVVAGIWLAVFSVFSATLWMTGMNNTELSCHANVHDYAGRDQILMNIDAALEKGAGNIVLKGKVIYADRTEHPFYITKFVSTQVNSGQMTMKKYAGPAVISRETDVGIMQRYLNHFFLQNDGTSLHQKLRRLEGTRDSRVIFSLTRVPYAVCISY